MIIIPGIITKNEISLLSNYIEIYEHKLIGFINMDIDTNLY